MFSWYVAFKKTGCKKSGAIPGLPGTGVSKYAYFVNKFLMRAFFSDYLRVCTAGEGPGLTNRPGLWLIAGNILPACSGGLPRKRPGTIPSLAFFSPASVPMLHQRGQVYR
jgi:hypothetical protein